MAYSALYEKSFRKMQSLIGAQVDIAPGPGWRWVDEKPARYSGEIERFFWENTDRAIDKWVHYLPLYERYFAPFRHRPVRVLEIGVQNGGSARMWRDWFGPEAILFGVDIDPACAQLDGESARVRIGSQDDATFLRSVVAEMGGLDVVIDDGSHVMSHIHSSFRTLFPLLSEGGVYLVEDLHTAYWADYEGGYRRRSSFLETVKIMIDDMHCWYHGSGQMERASADMLGGLHVHDSLVVIDKAAMHPPRRAMTGTTQLAGHGSKAGGS